MAEAIVIFTIIVVDAVILSISQLLHALSQRSNSESIFFRGNGQNLYLFISIVASAFVLMLILLVPYLRKIFSLTRLTAGEWDWVVFFSILPLMAVEVSKVIIRCKKKRI